MKSQPNLHQIDLSWLDQLTPYQAAQLLTETDLVLARERCEESLAEFVKGGWHVLEPGSPLIWNWHLTVLCGYLEAVHRGDITVFIANIPPGTMKSLIVSVFYPGWVMIHEPAHRFLCGSNDERLSGRDSLRHRQLVESAWYQGQWGLRMVTPPTGGTPFKSDWVRISSEQREKTLWQTTRRGHRESQSVTGRITGKRGDTILWDDPHDTEQTESHEQRQSVLEKWDGGWSTRLNNLAKSRRILVMQRIHVKDTTAHWQEIYPDAVTLRIPMRYEGEPSYDPVKDLGRPDLADPRTKEGELMFPEMFPEKAVRQQEGIFGPYRTAGQYQQRPSPKGGGEFRRENVMHYSLPPRNGNRYIIVDPAGEKKKNNTGQKRDNTAMVVVECCEDQNYYIIDAHRDRLDLTERTKILFEWHRKYRPLGVGYESDGFQSDLAHVRDRMEREQYRFKLIELRSKGLKKEDRIRTLLPVFAANRLWLPQSMYKTDWEGKTVDLVAEFIEKEYLPFPVASFDDLLDVISRITDPDMNIVFPQPKRPFRGVRTSRMRDPSTGY